MKEGFDKEIDSLLRRRVGAGAEARAFVDRGMPRDEAHLDADELSAFAEGALPASARVAAVSHMADCDECRGLAVNLARASGAEAELERRAVAAQLPASESVAARVGRRWWSSLLAPRALRYAAPALALCLVAVVSFVALRSRWKDAGLSQQTAGSRSPQIEVAKNQESGSPLDSTTTANANASGISQGTIGSESQNSNATDAPTRTPAAVAKDAAAGSAAGSAAPVVAEDKKTDEPSPPPAPKSEVSTDSSPAMSKAGPSVEAGETAKSESKEKSARQSQPEEETSYNESSVQQRRANNVQRGIDNVQMPDGARTQKRGAADNSPSNSSGSGGSLAAAAPRSDRDRSAAAPGAPASRRGRSSEEQRERSEDDEVVRAKDARSVAGHRFQRVGGAWVDVNYKSSMASTGVRRGTDAYRALVADIPEIGRVAEQLGGEVVVVVKGRAYRIR
jgi:hypothetical protein